MIVNIMSGNNELSIFGGHALPYSLQIMAKIMPDVPEALFKAVLKLAFDTVQKKPLPAGALDVIYKKENSQHIDIIYGGLLTLVQNIVRMKPEGIKEDDIRLGLKNLKFNEECSNSFTNLFLENKLQLHFKRNANSEFYKQISKVDWRIDISISSSHLCKAFDTIIILQLWFKNGEYKSFEVSVAKFHLLRLTVASLLKELVALEKKNALKS